jgi:methylglutaconyl-CoA hydratase
MNPYVKVKIDESRKSAMINFYHPKGNSMTSQMLDDIVYSIESFENNDRINTLVISSDNENVFCSGASFDELLQVSDQQSADKFFSGFAKLILAIKHSSKLIIASVQGKAVGGGIGLISACDFAFACSNSSIKLSELSIGIGPYVIAPAVERKIGKSAIQDLSFDPESWKSAVWAYEKGLFNRVFDDFETLTISLNSFLDNYSKYNSAAIGELKKFFWKGCDHWDNELFENASISAKLVLSDFTKAKLLKFKNRK